MNKSKLLQELEEEIIGDILEEKIFSINSDGGNTRKPDNSLMRGVKAGLEGMKAGLESGKKGAINAYNAKKEKDAELKKIKLAEKEALKSNKMLQRFLKTMKDVLKTQLANLGQKTKYDDTLKKTLTAMSEDEEFLNKWVAMNGEYLAKQIELVKKTLGGEVDKDQGVQPNTNNNTTQTPAPEPIPAKSQQNTIGDISDAK